MHMTMSADGPELDIPEHPEGEPWVHILEHGGAHGDEITYADTAAEALAVLISGYGDIPDDDIEEAEIARFEHAAQVASVVQAHVVQRAIEKAEFSLEDADEDTLTALMTDKTRAISVDGAWSREIPLILVDLNYAPYSPHPVPTGNVVLLSAHNEVDYLTSLSALGMVRYYARSTGEDYDEFGDEDE